MKFNRTYRLIIHNNPSKVHFLLLDLSSYIAFGVRGTLMKNLINLQVYYGMKSISR